MRGNEEYRKWVILDEMENEASLCCYQCNRRPQIDRALMGAEYGFDMVIGHSLEREPYVLLWKEIN